MITDDLWAAMEPLVSRAKGHKGGRPAGSDVLRGPAVHRPDGRAAADLPAEFGARDAVYNRFRRQVASGAMARLFEAMTADPQFGEVRQVLIDSTTVRAHRHAAGAPRKKAGSAPAARRGLRGSAAAGAG
jgi:putative transposase